MYCWLDTVFVSRVDLESKGNDYEKVEKMFTGQIDFQGGYLHGLTLSCFCLLPVVVVLRCVGHFDEEQQLLRSKSDKTFGDDSSSVVCLLRHVRSMAENCNGRRRNEKIFLFRCETITFINALLDVVT
jgi:hypothetical protein